MGRDVGDPGAQEPAQLRLGVELLRRDDLLGPHEQRRHQLLVDQEEKLPLAVDVVVEAAPLQPGRVDEIVDRGVRIAALGEQPRRHVDHLAAALLEACPRARTAAGWSRAGVDVIRGRHGSHSPRCRAMTIRWISFVPSPISRIFWSR